MKKIWTLSLRTAKEILRDPLNLLFGLGFPLVVLFLLTAIQANIPLPLFELQSLTPGIAVFGLAFLSLSTAVLVAKDRETAFLSRLYTTPMQAYHFILGYALPVLPIALLQSGICYLAAVCLGLTPTLHILSAIAFALPISLFFIGVGVLCGSILNVKGASGVCGGLFTNLTAWLSGTWFDVALVGGGFVKIANLLPFAHAVEMGRAVLNGNYAGIFPHLYWVLGYAIAFFVGATVLFLRQMKK